MRRSVKVLPIRNELEFDRALARVEILWGAKRGTPAGAELDLLGDLIAAYDSRHHRIPPSSPVRVLRHLMEANGLTANDLPEIGSRAVVSAILAGKRRLLERHRRALSSRFKVPLRVFRLG